MIGDISIDMTDPIEQIHTRFFRTGPTNKRARSGQEKSEDTGDWAYSGEEWTTNLTPDQVIDKARSAKNGTKFTALFDRADTSTYGDDPSRAEAALANMIAFYTGPNRIAIKQVMNRSAMVRDKWRDHPTYLDRTISAVLKKRGSDPASYWSRGKKRQSAQEESGGTSSSDEASEQDRATHRFNASDLLRQKLDPPKPIVSNRLNDGLTISAGPPKVGKSWMKLALGIAVATGGEWLGETVTNPGDVLYLALEDSPRRLQNRLQKVLYSDSGPFVIEGDTDDDMTFDLSSLPDMPDRLDIWTACPRLDKGGLQEIEGWLKDHADARLVIIDTLAKVRPPRSPNGNMYDDDYRALEGLQQLALKYGVAIVVVHHLRKMESTDPLERLSGSMAISGAADSIFVLTRERGKDSASLFITGRDVEHERELALTFDPHTVQWLVMGDAEEVRRSSEQKEVIDVLIEAGEPLTPAEVADRLGLPRNRIKQRLYQMSKKHIVKNDKGKYSFPTSK